MKVFNKEVGPASEFFHEIAVHELLRDIDLMVERIPPDRDMQEVQRRKAAIAARREALRQADQGEEA